MRVNIRELEKELWEAADLLRQGSKLTSNEYCMPVLGLIFLRYAYSRFRFVEGEIMKNRPMRGGRALPVEPVDFVSKSAIYLPEEARYDYLLNLPASEDLGKAVNHAMELVEEQSAQLRGMLPKTYTSFRNELLEPLLRIFDNSALNDIKDDVIGRIYEYFLNKFSPAVASDDGVFFTPKSLVRMIVNVIEPSHGTVLDPACGSGGMFVSSADFIEQYGASANTAMTFFGQEKVDYNAKLCIMNMAVHGLNAKIVSGDEANSFYNDHFNLDGCCDYVMANPPFNVDKVKSETAQNAGRLPFGLPGVNKSKEVSNANYLWISYFYSYLNESGRAGFVMASSATDSQGKDKEIRQKLVETGHVDVMVSVGNNFFYTKSLPCTLWFFDKGKDVDLLNKVLFIDARNYYTAVDRTLNEWSPWQLKNLNAIVWLYRGETEKYKALIDEYRVSLKRDIAGLIDFQIGSINSFILHDYAEKAKKCGYEIKHLAEDAKTIPQFEELNEKLSEYIRLQKIAASEQENYLKEHSKKNDAKGIVGISGSPKKHIANTNSMINSHLAGIQEIQLVIKEASWLYEKFGEGEYKDILGLCRIEDRDVIAEKGWSLTPGAYVGVPELESDGVDFTARMTEIHAELLSLQAESNALMETISRNMKELGL